MINISHNLLIGKGSERSCYRHPHDANLCIKVTHYRKTHPSQNKRDYNYYKKLEKQNIDWSHLPRTHGWAETRQGKGLIFELAQDREGRPLSTLKTLLESGILYYSDIKESLEILHRYLVDNLIFTSDLRDSNIACDLSRPGPPHLYIIDGLGDHDFIKLAAVISTLGRRKVERQWLHFMRRMQKWNG